MTAGQNGQTTFPPCGWTVSCDSETISGVPLEDSRKFPCEDTGSGILLHGIDNRHCCLPFTYFGKRTENGCAAYLRPS